MKTLILILFPLLSFGQIQFDLETKYPYYPEKDGRILTGKPARQGWQLFAVAGVFVLGGVTGVLGGDEINNHNLEIGGYSLLFSAFPFVFVGINKHYKASVNREYLEAKYPQLQ